MTAGPDEKPALLFLCHTLPFPPDGGVWIRTFNLLRELSASFRLTILCFERLGSARERVDREKAVQVLSSLGEVEVFSVPQNRSTARLLLNHVLSVMTQRVYTRFLYRSGEYRERIRALLRDRDYALVHVDSLDLSDYLEDVAGMPTACTHHNVESELLKRRAGLESNPARSAYFRLQSRLTLNEEKCWCPKVALNVMCSELDAQILRGLAPRSRTLVVPNGVDTEEFLPVAGAKRGAAFVGATSWAPNGDALAFFADDILPRIRAADPEYPVHWIGSVSSDERTRYAQSGIDLAGYVEDIRPLMASASTFVVPLRVGGGTRLKILTAWSMGCAVVSTSIGAEGLKAVDGENILIRNDAQAFAEAVIQLEHDDTLRNSLAKNARLTAERIYSWKVIGRGMISAYQALIA